MHTTKDVDETNYDTVDNCDGTSHLLSDNKWIGEKGSNLSTGIYYGLVSIEGMKSPLMNVTSVGWNPFYKNEKKAVEVHVLANLDDFYDKRVTVTLFGYLRDECSFSGVGEG